MLTAQSDLFRRAYVYGSVARGEQDELSDIDLVLIRDTDRPFFDRIRDVMDFVLNLGRADVLIYTEEEKERLQSEPGRYFIKDVFREGYTIEGTQNRGAEMAPAGRE